MADNPEPKSTPPDLLGSQKPPPPVTRQMLQADQDGFETDVALRPCCPYYPDVTERDDRLDEEQRARSKALIVEEFIAHLTKEINRRDKA